MKNHSKNVVAKLLLFTSSNSAEMAANSRCVYLFHQPKQPSGIKTIKK